MDDDFRQGDGLHEEDKEEGRRKGSLGEEGGEDEALSLSDEDDPLVGEAFDYEKENNDSDEGRY